MRTVERPFQFLIKTNATERNMQGVEPENQQTQRPKRQRVVVQAFENAVCDGPDLPEAANHVSNALPNIEPEIQIRRHCRFSHGQKNCAISVHE